MVVDTAGDGDADTALAGALAMALYLANYFISARYATPRRIRKRVYFLSLRRCFFFFL